MTPRNPEARAMIRAMILNTPREKIGNQALYEEAREIVRTAIYAAREWERGQSKPPYQIPTTDSATQPEIQFCEACGTPLGIKEDR